VELDHGELFAALDHRVGQGAQARTDFDQVLTGLRRNRAHDLVDDTMVNQKILTKALAGDVSAAPLHGTLAARAGGLGAGVRAHRAFPPRLRHAARAPSLRRSTRSAAHAAPSGPP